jgi:hypothetical protein
MKSSDKEVFSGNLKQTPEQERITELERKLKDAELGTRYIKSNRHLSKTVDDLYFHQNNEKIFPIEKCEVAIPVIIKKSQSVSERNQRKLLKLTSIYFLNRNPSKKLLNNVQQPTWNQTLGLRSKLSKKSR